MSDFDQKSLDWCEASIESAKPCPFCGEKLTMLTDHHGAWIGHRNAASSCFESICQLHDDSDLKSWNKRDESELASLKAEQGAVWNDAVEKAAEVARPKEPRPCSCDKDGFPCDCAHSAKSEDVAIWDAVSAIHFAIASLSPSTEGMGRESLPKPIEVWACLHHDIYLGASKYSRERALDYASDGEVYRATLTFKEKLK